MKTLVIKTCIIVCFSIECVTLQSLSPPVWSGNTIAKNGYEEDFPIGHLLGTITATARNYDDVVIEIFDANTDERITLTYNNTGNDATGYIFLKKELDREKLSSWELFFKAFDSKIHKDQVAAYRVTISILDINDNPPRFDIPFYQGDIKENATRGTSVLSVSASDEDNGGGGSVVFSLEPAGQVCNVVCRKDFSTDSNATTHIVEFLYKNRYLRLYQQLTLQLGINAKGEEQTQGHVKTSIGFIISKEGNSPDSTKGIFKINRNTGLVTLESTLNFEKTSFYQYLIIAEDLGHPKLYNNASLVIKVLDVQDSEPFFEGLPYMAHINENETIETQLKLPIQAYDRDIGVPNSIDYHIIDDGSCSGIFKIDKASGNISTKVNWSVFDRDKPPISNVNGVCKIVVEARETNSSGFQQTKPGVDRTNTTVTITVHDLNDNSPVFNQTNYNASITEDISGIPLTLEEAILVHDNDQDSENNHFSLVLQYLNGTQVDNNHINPQPNVLNGGGQIVLRLHSRFKYDYESYHQVQYRLVATEVNKKESTGSCTITVNITDANDHSPVFTNIDYTGSPAEHYANGRLNTAESVLEISATDKDSGDFGTITYSLIGKYPNFEINNITGELRTVVSNDSLLDREKQPTHILIVSATDGGGRFNTTTVTVRLKDVNDNAPQFNPGYRQFSVEENRDKFDTDIVISASDNDEDKSNNSIVKYNLTVHPNYLGKHFNIDQNNGTITLNSSIDYEEGNLNELNGQVLLTIDAYDLGDPQLTTQLNITVNVQDANDNEPIFTTAVFYFNLTENSNSSTKVGIINATDNDGTDTNRKISYYIETGGMDKFRINGNTGLITVDLNAKIDREEFETYNLTVLAIDRGTPPKNGTASVIISVIDKNDERPKFHHREFKASMKEATNYTNVTQCEAYDHDLNSNLSYKIYNAEVTYSQWANKTESAVKIFRIDNNGILYLESSVDREVFSAIKLSLEVIDLNGQTEDQRDTANLTISIADVNDNEPYFNSSTDIKIQEGALSGPVKTLTAIDHDLNTKFSFSIMDKPRNAFFLETTKSNIGSVQLSRLGAITIDREVNDTLELIIFIDDGVHKINTTFNITVEDVNDNAPKFVPQKKTINLKENFGTATYTGHHVTRVCATDEDIGPNANLTYRLFLNEQETEKFQLYLQNECDIYVNGTIDRERVSAVTFIIKAEDNPENPLQQLTGTATVTINVLDLNDNPPKFKGRFVAPILEDAKKGAHVLTLTADDPDDDGNNQYFFNFTKEQQFFNLDNESGIITVNSDLLNHYGIHVLPVEVVDVGNSNLTDFTYVNITVQDINNNIPVFDTSQQNFKIYECAKNYTLVTTVNATDADAEGVNSKIEYAFSSLNAGNINSTFTIDNTTGEIRTIRKLNAIKQLDYQILVLATDHGVPVRFSSRQEITIHVIDVNDNPPQFYPNKTFVKIKEEESNVKITTVVATDDDLISEIVYSIESVERADLSDYFEIYHTSGELFIRKPLDREYENQTNAKITVRATDITARNISVDCDNTETDKFSNSTTISVILTVEDINDNPPEFKEPGFFPYGIRRNSKLNTIIEDFKNKTLDPDIGVNRIHTFSLNGDILYSSDDLKNKVRGTNPGNIADCPKDQKSFPVCLTPNGTLLTNMLFEENMKGHITITIVAQDDAGTATAVLRIDIISDDQTAAMLIYDGKSFVQQHQDEILGTLGALLGYKFTSNGIESYVQDGITDALRTYLYFHVIDKNDEVLSAQRAKEIIDSNAQKVSALAAKFKISAVKEYKDTLPQDEDEGIKTIYIMVGITIILGITVITVGFCYCHSITRYQRKLKAATTKTTADVDLKESHPGTNIYARSTNPLLDKEVDLKNVDYKRYEDNLSVASYDSMQFEKKEPVGGDEEKGAVMDMFDETVAIQGDADALAMVLEQHKRERGESNMMSTPPSDDDDELLNTEDFKHSFDNETFELNLETTEV